MASGDTKLSICSDALILLGAKPLSSFRKAQTRHRFVTAFMTTSETAPLGCTLGLSLSRKLNWPEPSTRQSMSINTNINSQETASTT